jgi:hypothetical protein
MDKKDETDEMDKKDETDEMDKKDETDEMDKKDKRPTRWTRPTRGTTRRARTTSRTRLTRQTTLPGPKRKTRTSRGGPGKDEQTADGQAMDGQAMDAQTMDGGWTGAETEAAAATEGYGGLVSLRQCYDTDVSDDGFHYGKEMVFCFSGAFRLEWFWLLNLG